MKYREFEKKIKALGDKYSVSYYDYMLRVYYKGEWVATVQLNKQYAYKFQQAWDGYWGSDTLRCKCIELIHQLAKTKPKNRGKVPANVKTEFEGLVLI